MGLAEATMKHRELGMKNGMLERNLLVHEWEMALDAHEWLTVRYPQVKNIKSHDGDAPSRLEIWPACLSCRVGTARPSSTVCPDTSLAA